VRLAAHTADYPVLRDCQRQGPLPGATIATGSWQPQLFPARRRRS
jgi:hypothetical protein